MASALLRFGLIGAHAAVPQQDLVVYYPFNGNADDQGGSSQHGTLHGACAFTTDRFGVANAALSLSSATPGAVRVKSALLPTGSVARTVSVWIKPNYGNLPIFDSFTTAGDIVSFGPWSTNGNGLYLSAKLEYGTNFVPVAVIPNAAGAYIYAAKPADMSWHHLALTFNGSLAILYVDGKQSAIKALAINTPGDELLVGRTHGGYSPYDGAIDDLRIYGRVLSGADINALYREPAPANLANPARDADADAFNYGLGTQTFQPQYQFTTKTKLVETAEAMEQMGTGVIKFFVGKEFPSQYGITLPPAVTNLSSLAHNEASCRAVLDMPFRHYILWAYPFTSPGSWADGFSDQEKQAEYAEMYDFTRYLLNQYAGSSKTFYLGHREGDWYLLPDFNTLTNSTPTTVQGMRDWLNTRQQAVDDAKRDTPHSDVDVFVYTEVNRVRDAMQGWQRVINEVVPYVTNLDYVSYSSYDMENLSPSEITRTLDYAESQMPTNKASRIFGKRLFIGEYGWGGEPPEVQESRSRSYVKTVFGWGCPFVLWWEMYNNEFEMNWCLINSGGERTPNYYFHQRFLNAAKLWCAEFKEANRRVPTATEYRQWAVGQLDSPIASPPNLNVTTVSATSAGQDGAVVTGTSRPGVYGDNWGRLFVAWGPSDGGTNLSAWEHVTDLGISPSFLTTTFSALLTPLDPQRIYHYRSYATNTSGFDWSQDTGTFSLLTLQTQSFDSAQGLVVYYPFNSNYQDESGHLLDGSPSGKCDFTTNRFGISKTALSLSTKTPGAVRVRSDLLPHGNAPRTISVWVKPDFKNLTVVSSVQKAGTVVASSLSDDGLWFEAKLGYGTNFWTTVAVTPTDYLATTQALDDKWHHLLVAFDGVFAAYYIDGKIRQFAQLPVNTRTSELVIGQLPEGGKQYAGAIDDLRIYNRTMSPAEVEALYTEPERPGFDSIGLFPGFILRGIVGTQYTIQYATNVSSSSWTTLTNVTLTIEHQMWIDMSADVRSQERRFYRAIQP